MSIVVILSIIIALMTFPFVLGLLLFFHVFVRRKKSPADSSNRINHMRLVWFALTREDLFIDLFPWLKNDEYENVKDKQQ